MGDTQKEALAKRDEYKRREAAGLKAEYKGITVRQYAAKWLSTYKSGVTTKVYNEYALYLERLSRSVGQISVRDVATSDIQTVYNDLRGKSSSYIRKCGMTIKGMFAAAVDDGVTLRNPCNKATLPNGSSGTHRVLTQEERQLIHSSVSLHSFAPVAMTMLYAGLRRGEALALNIDRDVDYARGTITVREAVRFEQNRPVLCDPKTEAGVREIPLLEPLRAVLEDRHGLLAHDTHGNHMSETVFRNNFASYKRCLELLANGTSKAKYLKHKTSHSPAWKPVDIRTHDFRHSFCTMLYDAGIDIKTAQKWMGHADQTMILKVYAHLTSEREASAAMSLANKVNEVLSGMQNGMQKS